MPVLAAADAPAVLRRGGSARVDANVPARFAAGDRVTVRNLNPFGHTRAPRYVRCKTGLIERDHGVFIFPDTHAHGQGKRPQHVYSVRFTARDLWGDEATSHDAVYVDLWDEYLTPA
jgi:nitrile hydratase subunit beta